jgi:hypothetical protein
MQGSSGEQLTILVVVLGSGAAEPLLHLPIFAQGMVGPAHCWHLHAPYSINETIKRCTVAT